MEHGGQAAGEHAHGCIRSRGPARRGGDDDAGPLPVVEVRLYTAGGCHLCERARATLEELQRALKGELDFELVEVAIDGDSALEACYREWLPVVEIDGRRAFSYYVQPDVFRRKLAAQSGRSDLTL